MAVKTSLTRGLYKGYSSFEFERVKQFQVLDIELVKLELLSHIFTRHGERVMMPTWGTRIPEQVFEPMTEEVVDLIKEELQDVFDFDPRVQVIELDMIPYYDEGRLEAVVRLLYIEINTVDTLNLNLVFENQN